MISGFDEMCAIRWSAASRMLPLRVPEDGVRRAVAGSVEDLELSVVQLERLAVGERAGDRRARAPGPKAPRHALERDDDVLGNAASEHELGREAIVELGVLGEVREPADGLVERRDLGAGVLDDDLDQADVVDVLVGEDHQLDVVDRVAQLLQLILELVERLARVRARCRRA